MSAEHDLPLWRPERPLRAAGRVAVIRVQQGTPCSRHQSAH
jgi:hypothetical protein